MKRDGIELEKKKKETARNTKIMNKLNKQLFKEKRNMDKEEKEKVTENLKEVNQK